MRSSPLLAKYTSLPGCCRGTDGHCVATSSNQSANNPLITENIKEMKMAMGLSQIMNLPNLLWNFQSPPMAFTSGSLISWRWFNCNQEWNAGHVIQRWGFQLSCISFSFLLLCVTWCTWPQMTVSCSSNNSVARTPAAAVTFVVTCG